MSKLFRLSVIAAVLLAVLALAACGGKKHGVVQGLTPGSSSDGSGSLQAADNPAVEPAFQSLDEAIAELDALDTPDGVDDALFAELKIALASRLTTNNEQPTTARFASTPPTGEANRVNDLSITDNGDGTFTLSWHYRNLGDYDQNGTVGIEDITPIAQHFGEEVPPDDTNRNSIQAVIDGSENGVVDIADIVVIAQRFATEVDAYLVEGAHSAEGLFQQVESVAFGQAADEGRLCFQFIVSTIGFRCVHVVATDSQGMTAEPSNLAYIPETGRGDWWMFGRDAQHSHTSPYVGPQRNPTLLWKTAVGTGYSYYSPKHISPVIRADGTLYIRGDSGNIYAVNPDGTVEWEYDAGACEESNPAIGMDGTVYVGCGYLRAIGADGVLKWEYEDYDLHGPFQSSPLVAPDGTIYIGSSNWYRTGGSAFLHALNPDGTPSWIIELPLVWEWTIPAAASRNGTIYIAGIESLYAVNPDGTIKWEQETGYIYSGPSLDARGNIYLRTTDNSIKAYSEDGELLWSVHMGDGFATRSAPVIASDGTIYIGNNDSSFYALNPDGSIRWKFETGYDVHSTAALDADGSIYFGCDDGYFYALDAEGTLLWRLDLGDLIRSSPAIGADGTVYCVTRDGYLCAVAESVAGQEPVAVLTATPMSGSAPLTVSFDASQSYDPDGSIALYEWDPDGDGAYVEALEGETSFSYTYDAAGMYTAGLRVTDNSGLTHTATVTIIVDGDNEQGDWWMFGHDAQHTRRSPFIGPQTATVKWKYRLGQVSFGRYLSSPAVADDGTVYVGSLDNHLYALNPNGTLKWKYETESSIRSSPAIAPSGVVYVGGDDSHFYAINPDGTLNWRRRLGYTVVSSPVITPDGTIYVGCSDSYLYAFNPDGSIKWRFNTGDWICSSPAIGAEGIIYVASTDGYLYAVNPDGSMAWCFRAYRNLQASPCIASDGTIYISSTYRLYAISESGFLRWTHALDNHSYSNPALCSDGMVYLVDIESTFYIFLPDGTVVLKCDLPVQSPIDSLSSPATGADGTAYIGYGDGIVAVAMDGQVLWQYETQPQRAVHSSPALAEDGTLYVGCEDGYLYAFADEISEE